MFGDIAPRTPGVINEKANKWLAPQTFNAGIAINSKKYPWFSTQFGIDIGAGGSVFADTVGSISIGNNLYYGYGAWTTKVAAQAALLQMTTGNFYWYTAPSVAAGATPVFGQPAMALVNSGNVGIGVAAPDSALQVLGPSNAGLRVGWNNTPVNYYDASTHHFRNASSAAGFDLVNLGGSGVATLTYNSATYAATANMVAGHVINNLSTTMQSVLEFQKNGVVSGRVRNDYAGGMSYITTGAGGHVFWTGGDSSVGTAGVAITTTGLAVGASATPHQYGDLGLSRNSAPTTGCIYFGNDQNNYLYYDGTCFNFVGAPIVAYDNVIYNSALTQWIQFMPASAQPYGGLRIGGVTGGYAGVQIWDGTNNPIFMSSSGAIGIYKPAGGTAARWVCYDNGANFVVALPISGSLTGNCSGSSGSCTGNAATSSSCSGNAVSANTVAASASRTDPTAYQIGWISVVSGQSQLYSCAACTITSSTGLISCTSLTASANITAYSDIRLKSHIEIIPDALAKIKTLRGVTFNRTDHEGRYTGLIAQEVEKILPEAVVTAPSNEEQTKSLAYGNLAGIFVEAFKELDARLLAVEKKVA